MEPNVARPRKILRTALAAAALLVLAGMAGPRPQAPVRTRVRLVLQWSPQSQFAGYFVAQAKGLYAARGLDVEILPGGPGLDPVRSLESGEADVATLWLSSALLARDRGLLLVLLAQVVNRSNLCLVAWRDRGISTVKDLEGRRVSLWEEPHRSPYMALFAAQGVRPVIVPQYCTVELFLRRGVDACAAMRYNEVNRIYLAGVNPEEVTILSLADLGFGSPEDGLYAPSAFVEAHPEAARAFAEASMEGWKRARENPAEALTLVMERVRESRLPKNGAHMRWMLNVILSSIFPSSGDGWKTGVLGRGDFERTAQFLKSRGLVSAVPAYGEWVGQGGAGVP